MPNILFFAAAQPVTETSPEVVKALNELIHAINDNATIIVSKGVETNWLASIGSFTISVIWPIVTLVALFMLGRKRSAGKGKPR